MRDIAALIRLLDQRVAEPFAWGRHANDCVGFALAAAQAQLGRDLLPGVTWSSERGAIRVVRRLGGLVEALDARLNRVAPAHAQRGDVAGIVDGVFGVTLAVVEGVSIVGPGDHGLLRLPRSAMAMAWSIE